MSTNVAEGPDPEGIRPHFENVYANAYLSFMEGIVLRDVETLHWAGNIIEQSGYPLADCVDESASHLEDAIYGTDAERLAEVIDYSFADTVRSYIYSGLETDASMISFCATLLRYNKSQLRQIVFPEYNLPVLLGMSDASAEEMANMRYYGRRALIQLGLGSMSLKVAYKLGLMV